MTGFHDVLQRWIEDPGDTQLDRTLTEYIHEDPPRAHQVRMAMQMDEDLSRLLLPQRQQFVTSVRNRRRSCGQFPTRVRSTIRRRQQQQRQRIWMAAALAIAGITLAVSGWLWLRPTPPPMIDGQPATWGSTVTSDEVRHITFPDGIEIRMPADSRIHLDHPQRITLSQGAVQVHVPPDRPQAFIIDGPRSQVQVLGTRFTHSTDALGDVLHVSSGMVQFHDLRSTLPIAVTAGDSWVIPSQGNPVPGEQRLIFAFADQADPRSLGWSLGQVTTGGILSGEIESNPSGRYRGLRLHRKDPGIFPVQADSRLRARLRVNGSASRLVIQMRLPGRPAQRFHVVYEDFPKEQWFDIDRLFTDFVDTRNPHGRRLQTGDVLTEMLIYTHAATDAANVPEIHLDLLAIIP